MSGARRAAFFDVDDTLITVKSMFRFLEHDRPPAEYRRVMAELRALKASGLPREVTGRAFYRTLAGRDVAEVAGSGAAWFAAELDRGGLFDREVLALLRGHAGRGDLIVLVSGSFPACLDPLAAHVGAHVVLCSRPEVRRGRYTGGVAAPMIGDRKAAAVLAAAALHGLSLDASYAYGDHLSDVPLMKLVGNPVMVGDDPALGEHALRHGWPRLARTAA
ncbi:HAD family hydrolase [Actinomadura roseirufa]|uniref:HAD family hydrolase n=1 Tax=Actinomadura roseirufa TaxID=2094049 RepID=UPI001F5F35E7|nr:HAD-IB family hydrolase [Actinomadura roseirufa]